MNAKLSKPVTDRARRFRLLADENRLRILERLLAGPSRVSDLVEGLTVEQSLVSHHLSALRREGLVETERVGREIHYKLAPGVTEKRGGVTTLELGCCRIQLR